jgi:hypothetical protein
VSIHLVSVTLCRFIISCAGSHETVADTVTYTRCCIDTIDSPDDAHEVARNT